MYKTSLLVIVCVFLISSIGFSQVKNITVKGIVLTESGSPVHNASVALKETPYASATNAKGVFELIAPTGNYKLLIAHVGFATQELSLNINAGESAMLKVVLYESKSSLNEVSVVGKTEVQIIKETGFSVESIESKELQNQSIQINRLLDWTPGVRVRQQGGIGSDYKYSINGLSGNAITFFIDGIPMNYFGSSFTINNLPISLVKRIDVYKGVVPVDLGADALGGAINVVSNSQNKKFLEISYSHGSFKTREVVLNGQFINPGNHLTTRISSFYTSSDNNYKVWGKGVNYADSSSGFKAVDFTKNNPATRFNDQFQTLNFKADIGFTDKKWADQFFVSLLGSRQKKGIQTGQTMATVYGKLHYKESMFMPHLSYQKRGLLTKGLNVNLFSGYTDREGTTVDTAMAFYNWKGDQIKHEQGGGEIARNGQSLYTMYEQSWINRANLTYELTADLKLGFNYFSAKTNRHGKDPYLSAFRVPLTAPQNINTQFAGLSLETKKFREKLNLITFIKWYDFKSTSNKLEYYLVNGEYQATAVPIKNNKSNLGAGVAASYKLHPLFLTKFSIEQATRLPTPTEALGDGILVVNNPEIKPEQSLNINLGIASTRIRIGEHHGLRINTGVFYRDTKDQLLYRIAKDDGAYENIGKTLGKGVELELAYDLDQWLKINTNVTYLDIRNNQRVANGTQNVLFRDRLRNTPYLLGNAGISANLPDILKKGGNLFTYIHGNYLHEFFLYWPSLGSKDSKNLIPSQFVFDFGVGYTFPEPNLSLALDLSNFTNTQTYDNFLLQKPGRSAFIKVRYQIK